MNMHRVLVGLALGALLSTPAIADGLSGKLRGQAQIEVMPSGSFSTDNGSTSTSFDTDTAYGLTAMLDYEVTPYLAVGVAPRLVLNVRVSDAVVGNVAFHDSAGEELDLRAHVLGHVPVSRAVELYASLSPGYAAQFGDHHDDLAGFALAGAIGATYAVSPRVFVSGELGYQHVFSRATNTIMIPGVNPITVTSDTSLSYLHIGLGAGTHF